MNLDILNNKQKEAVVAGIEKAILVIAGAGSGKTRVLTHRIAWLIEQKFFKPEHILALTFTNKAAHEMKERVLGLIETKAASPVLGTFHSVCVRILRREIGALGYRNEFVIYDSDDQLRVIKNIHEELGIGKSFAPGFFKAQISRAKNLMQSPDELDLPLDKRILEKVQQVYVRYQNFLHEQSAVDFDDLLLLTIKIFQNFPKALERYQKLFQYILVDEYQDTNPAQFELLRLLVTKNNIFVVGDDAQSIYGFRGSDIRNILNFENLFNPCETITLEQNYRSSRHILDAASSVIALNVEQKPKELWTERKDGEKVTVYEAEDERAESEFVAKKIIGISTHTDTQEEEEVEGDSQSYSILDLYIKKSRNSRLRGVYLDLPAHHDDLSKFAVLYRTHAQSRALEEVFIRASIPYKIIGGIRFYERKEIKDFLSYIRVIENYKDRLALERIINYPSRGLGDKSQGLIFDELMQSKAETLNLFLDQNPFTGLTEKQRTAAVEFFQQIQDFIEFDPVKTLAELMMYIFKRTSFEKLLKDGTEVGEARVENVKELFTSAKKFDNMPWKEGVTLMLEDVALLSSQDEAQSGDYVTLMTLHSAKGLEFDTVFFVGMEEGILPHSRSLIDPTELSEEVRLAYVGMTRARHKLYLIYAKQRFVFGSYQSNLPSRFLKVLPKESIQTKGKVFSDLDDGEVSYEVVEF